MLTSGESKSTYLAHHHGCCLTRYIVGQVILIDILPDDVLLAIFDLYVNED